MIDKDEVENRRVRYLTNIMTEEEAAEYEIYLMESPDELESIELTKVFLDTAPDIRFESSERSNNRNKSAWKKSIGRVLSSFSLGATFSALAIWFYLPMQIVSTSPNIYFLEAQRSAIAKPIVVESKGSGKVILFVQMSDMGIYQYSLSITDFLTEKKLVNNKEVESNEAGEVVVILDVKEMNVNQVRASFENLETKEVDVYEIFIKINN